MKRPFVILASLLLTAAVPTHYGLEWTDGIEPGTASECEAPEGNTCYWVDCDAVSDGTGTHASPYWGFETVAGYCTGGTPSGNCLNGGSFTQGSAVGGDYIYVKGTCDASTDTESSAGPFHQLKLYRAAQMGSAAEPTVIKSWRGTSRAIFNLNHDSDAQAAIELVDATETAGNYVKVQNVQVLAHANSGIHIQGPTGVTIYSVEVADGNAQGDGTRGSIMFYGQGSQQYDHLVEKSYFNNNDNSPTGGANNRGSVGLVSESSAAINSQMVVKNSLFTNELHAIRHKHNGNIQFRIFDNKFKNVQTAVYARVRETYFYQNLVIDAFEAVMELCSENQTVGVDAYVYNNTIIDSAKIFTTYCGAGSNVHAPVEFYNNIYDSPSAGNQTIIFGEGGGNTFELSNYTADHNMYDLSAAATSAFLVHEGTGYSFSNGLTELGETNSGAGSTTFTDPTSDDYTYASGESAASFGRSGSYIGAYNPSSSGGSSSSSASSSSSSSTSTSSSSGAPGGTGGSAWFY